MADSADRVLKILLQMGVVGQSEVQLALAQLQAQATEVAATVKKVSAGEWLGSAGQKITDANVSSVTPQLAQAQAYQAELAAVAAQERTYAAEYAAEWTAANEAKAAAQTASVAKTEEEIAAEATLAAAKAATNLVAERRVIIETQLEAAEARIAGNPGLATKLEREADIRTRSLSIQRALNVSTEESIVLAERLVLAEEATAVAGGTMGINIGKARQEATVLARELAVGNVRASTLGSLLGSLGPTITIAGIAAYTLYKWITSAYEEEIKVQEEAGKFLDHLIEAQKEWQRMARYARDVGDEIKLADNIKTELAKASVDAAKWRSEELVWWKGWADKVAEFMRNIIPGAGAGFGANAAKLKAGIIEPTGTGQTPDTYAKEFADQREEKERIYKQTVDASVQAQLKGADSVRVWLDNLDRLPRSIAEYNQKLDEARAKVDRLAATLKAGGGDASSRAGLLGQYREALRDVKDIQGGLDDLLREQDKVNKKTKEGSEAHKEFSALLKGEQNTLQQIRLQQQLISKDPFLSIDAKQALLAANARQELATLNTEIQQQKTYIKNTALDPSQLEQAQGKMQEMVARAVELRQQLAATSTFGGQLRTEFAQWGNSFGTAAHQITGAITGGINAGLQSMNQLILTGKFNVKSLVSSLAQIGLTLIEQFAIQEALKLAGITTSTTEASTAGADVAASWATAATMVSVATEGQADLTGAAGLAASVAFGNSLAAAKEGLYIDRGTHGTADDVLVKVSKGEGIINAHTVEAHGGRSWVDGINSGVIRPGFALGGMIGSGITRSSSSAGASLTPKLEIHVWHDFATAQKEFNASTAGRKMFKKSMQRNRV